MKIPGKATISNRTSTMASQFARARAPYHVPTPAEKTARCQMLGIDPDTPACVYCGAGATEWDHLLPMVKSSQWTGYFTEIANLVPACGKCNQSRGSKNFATWMRSRAPWSPLVIFQERDGLSSADAFLEVERRVALIERVLVACPPRRVDWQASELENELEECRVELNRLLHRAEALAAQLRQYYQLLPHSPGSR